MPLRQTRLPARVGIPQRVVTVVGAEPGDVAATVGAERGDDVVGATVVERVGVRGDGGAHPLGDVCVGATHVRILTGRYNGILRGTQAHSR